jgi:septal ring factor EnvC (AmiA/AmiB activator)
MSEFSENEYEEPEEDTDPTIRELRAEILRLEAQLDQLAAGVRERAAETAAILAQLADLERRLADLERRRRRDMRLLRITWVFIFATLAMTAFNYFSQVK